MASALKASLLSYVAINNDQTDGIVTLLEDLKNRTPNEGDEHTLKLTIDHILRLQRSLAKAIDSEITYMEILEIRRQQ